MEEDKVLEILKDELKVARKYSKNIKELGRSNHDLGSEMHEKMTLSVYIYISLSRYICAE